MIKHLNFNLSFRHSKEMIQRLENAGLGFYVKATKTVHKLGMPKRLVLS